MKLDNKTMEELQALRVKLENDPQNKDTSDSLYIYDKKTRSKLEKIARAITDLMIEKKRKNGTYKPLPGYTGRKSNRR